MPRVCTAREVRGPSAASSAPARASTACRRVGGSSSTRCSSMWIRGDAAERYPETTRFALTGWRTVVDSNLRSREKPLRRETEQMLVIFCVELRWHPRENEFAVSSVRYPTLALNFGVARTVAEPIQPVLRTSPAVIQLGRTGLVELAELEQNAKTSQPSIIRRAGFSGLRQNCVFLKSEMA